MTEEAVVKKITPEAMALWGTPHIVYVRAVIASEIKADDVEGAEHLPDDMTLYAVHASDGTRVAVLDTREAAFFAARQHDMEPVSVH